MNPFFVFHINIKPCKYVPMRLGFSIDAPMLASGHFWLGGFCVYELL